MAAAAEEEEKEALSTVARAAEDAIKALWECAVIVEDGEFGDASEANLHRKVDEYVGALGRLDADGRRVRGDVPLDVVEKVDLGQNPDSLTRELFEMGSAKNEQVRGKLFAAKVIEQHLRARLAFWDSRNEGTARAARECLEAVDAGLPPPPLPARQEEEG